MLDEEELARDLQRPLETKRTIIRTKIRKSVMLKQRGTHAKLLH